MSTKRLPPPPMTATSLSSPPSIYTLGKEGHSTGKKGKEAGRVDSRDGWAKPVCDSSSPHRLTTRWLMGILVLVPLLVSQQREHSLSPSSFSPFCAPHLPSRPPTSSIFAQCVDDGRVRKGLTRAWDETFLCKSQRPPSNVGCEWDDEGTKRRQSAYLDSGGVGWRQRGTYMMSEA